MKGLQRRSIFSPENGIARLSNFTAKRSKTSHFFSYLPIENPSKRSGASPRRKLKSHSIRAAGMRSKIHIRASQRPLDWMSLNNKRLPCLLQISYYLTILFNDIQSKRGNQRDGLWLAPMNLATHSCRSNTVGF